MRCIASHSAAKAVADRLAGASRLLGEGGLASLGKGFAAALLVIILGALTAPQKAHAQSFFEKLFGGSSAPAPAPHPQSSAPIYPPGAAPLPGYRFPVTPAPPRATDTSEPHRSERQGSYRTVCVRTCDGYYWPVSRGVTRSRFYRDSGVCRSACGEGAKLYYAPNDAESEEFVDLTGRSYTKLPTAYRYRKQQVEGCSCKPAPWSAAELERHRQYALAEEDAAQRQRGPGDAPSAKPAAVGPSDPAVKSALDSEDTAKEPASKEAPATDPPKDDATEPAAAPRRPAQAANPRARLSSSAPVSAPTSAPPAPRVQALPQPPVYSPPPQQQPSPLASLFGWDQPQAQPSSPYAVQQRPRATGQPVRPGQVQRIIGPDGRVHYVIR